MYQKYIRPAVVVELEQQTEVEAVQLTSENANEVSDWCKGFAVVEHDALDHDKTYSGVNVPVSFGKRRASEGDYIIRNTKTNEFWVHSQGSFESMYKAV
jgi:hypothetical protein